MPALVEDLLLLARLDSGRPLEREPVDLTRLLLEAVADARVVGPDHHWQLDLPDEPVEVPGDEHAAAPGGHQPAHQRPPAHSRRHGRHGRLAATGRVVRMTVTDDGPGFPPDLAADAFERFTRGDSARTRDSGGPDSASPWSRRS